LSAPDSPTVSQEPPPRLRRDVGILGATMLGLGSIVGTGIFVSIGTAAGSAGSVVIAAIAVAAVVAMFNGLSSAQLAAAHPVSGGTYEYGYRWLHPCLGFTAGWMFLCAKSASAATAALGFAGYLLNLLQWDAAFWRIPFGLAAVTVVTVLVLSGIRLSSLFNSIVVSVTLMALVFFVVAGLPAAIQRGPDTFARSQTESAWGWPGFLEACALMFVAYTGYGRIATLGEEIRVPRRNIPISIIMTLLISMFLYVSVGWIAVATVGAETLCRATNEAAAPLEVVARQFDILGAGTIVAIGAITSMLGVLLNLVLGLSRVVLAMGRRTDLPAFFGKLNRDGTTPFAAVIGVTSIISGLVLLGNVKTTWSFSAFTVLIYYAMTNLSALQMGPHERRYPRVVPWLGLISCLFLACWVDRFVWITGVGLIAAGLAWWSVARWLTRFR